MKTPLFLFLALAGLVPVQAEVFRPRLAREAAWGPRTAVTVGYHAHHHPGHRYAHWRGGSDLYLSATFGHSHLHRPYSHWRHGPRWGVYARPVYLRPVIPVYADYDYYDSGYSYGGRPSRAASGLWLGALAGAVIGNNSGSLGHDAWRGALYGAGAGLMLGAVADHRARQDEAAAERAASVQREIRAAEAPAPANSPVTVINHYYNSSAPTPMSSANALFGRN